MNLGERQRARITIDGDPFSSVPTERVKDPLPGLFNIGDRVRAVHGPLEGTVGIVTVDRAGNFKDAENRFGPDVTGVSFYLPRRATDDQRFDSLVSRVNTIFGGDHEDLAAQWELRWFSNPEDLALIEPVNASPNDVI